jgi:hypothetical protein
VNTVVGELHAREVVRKAAFRRNAVERLVEDRPALLGVCRCCLADGDLGGRGYSFLTGSAGSV